MAERTHRNGRALEDSITRTARPDDEMSACTDAVTRQSRAFVLTNKLQVFMRLRCIERDKLSSSPDLGFIQICDIHARLKPLREVSGFPSSSSLLKLQTSSAEIETINDHYL